MKKITLEVVSVTLVVLFTYAAASKLLDHHKFYLQLHRAPYIQAFAGLLAFALPVGELLIVALLLTPRTKIFGLWASLTSLLIFTIYIGLMLSSGQHLPCSCGGIIQKLTWKQHLIFNTAFIALSAAGVSLAMTNRQKMPPDNRTYNGMLG